MREAGDRDRTSTSLHSARTAPRLEFFQIPRWPLPASMAMTRAPPETTTNPSPAISKSRPVRYLTSPITKPPAPPIPPQTAHKHSQKHELNRVKPPRNSPKTSHYQKNPHDSRRFPQKKTLWDNGLQPPLWKRIVSMHFMCRTSARFVSSTTS